MDIVCPVIESLSKELTVYDDNILSEVDGEIVFNIPDKSPAVIRDRIWKLADFLFSLPEELTQTDFTEDTTHYFMNGVYTRALFVKKGTLVLGKIHLKECTNILAMGDCTVLTETGCERVKAGFIGISPKGTQKLVYIHEDTIFVNVFLTNKTTVEEAEEEILSTNKDDLRDLA
jgi:hypothetical protein